MPTNTGLQDSRWWSTPVAALLRELGGAATGLASPDARARLRRHGPNAIPDRHRRSVVADFLRRFANPLVLILLAASAIAAATGEVASFFLIVAMVGLSVTLDFIQEYRAGEAARRLRQSVAPRARVLRDGEVRDVAVSQLVPGDVFLLAAGSLVPADARLLEARDLYVNQSLLTGESFPVEKHAGDLSEPAPGPEEAANAVFMGTSIVSGTARALACRTGGATAVGAISGVASQLVTGFDLRFSAMTIPYGVMSAPEVSAQRI